MARSMAALWKTPGPAGTTPFPGGRQQPDDVVGHDGADAGRQKPPVDPPARYESGTAPLLGCGSITRTSSAIRYSIMVVSCLSVRVATTSCAASLQNWIAFARSSWFRACNSGWSAETQMASKSQVRSSLRGGFQSRHALLS
jgi:hypothetical protein